MPRYWKSSVAKLATFKDKLLENISKQQAIFSINTRDSNSKFWSVEESQSPIINRGHAIFCEFQGGYPVSIQFNYKLPHILGFQD